MGGLEMNSDWTGVLVALIGALALVVGFFLISWFNRTWTRRSVGFIESRNSDDHLMDTLVEDPCSEDSSVL